MSNRGQHQEFWCGQSQIRLLCPWSLRAVTAGRGHYQDSLQKRPQWMVEGRGLRPGEGSANSHRREYRWEHNIPECELLVSSRWVSFHQTMWMRTAPSTADALADVYTLYLYTYDILYFRRDQLHYCLSAYERFWAGDFSEVVWIKVFFPPSDFSVFIKDCLSN